MKIEIKSNVQQLVKCDIECQYFDINHSLSTCILFSIPIPIHSFWSYDQTILVIGSSALYYSMGFLLTFASHFVKSHIKDRESSATEHK